MSTSKLENRYMEFRLGDQLYGLPLLTVKEVIQKPEITAVPNMPVHFEGMINLRGQILGVFNVRKKLGAHPRQANQADAEVIMVIEHQGISVGMIVDEVTSVLHPEPDKVKSAPLREGDPANEFVRSVIQTGKGLVLTVNITELLELAKYQLDKKAG